jgi:hypothetical protein
MTLSLLTRPVATKRFLALNVAKSHLPSLAIGRFANQRNFARIRCMPVANISGDVVARRDVPAE